MPSVFGCIPSGSRYGNVPNELVHRAGPPFLDNHYRGYQYNNSVNALLTSYIVYNFVVSEPELMIHIVYLKCM